MTDAKGNEHAPKGEPGGGQFTEKGGGKLSKEDRIALYKRLGKEVPISIGETPANDSAREPKTEDVSSSELDRLMGEEFKGVKGQAAIDKLMKEKRGHVKAAFHRDDIGDIDLFWGSDSVGLKHIIKRRAEQHINVDKFLESLAEVIEDGEVKRQEERGVFLIRHKEKVAIIAPEYHGTKCTYVLTAYKKN